VPLLSLTENIESVLHFCEPRLLPSCELWLVGALPTFSGWILVLAEAFQFLVVLLLVLPLLLLLLLPQLLRPNRRYGPD
jgi:hypothetical protein